MKRVNKILSLLLAMTLVIGMIATFTVSAQGDTVYVKVNESFGVPYCYMWNSSSDQDVAWPGTQMTLVGDNVYSYTPSKSFANVIFSSNGNNQTDDLVYPGPNNIYDHSTGKWDTYDVSKAEPSISISKKDGSSFKTESLTVTVTVNNADSAYYTVDGGTQQTISGTTDVTLGASTAVGSTVTLFVSATNQNGTVTSSATYLKKDASVAVESDGSSAPALGGYYATNPNGQVGKQASITIDGNISDWDSSMLIAQGVANDDPRVYLPSSMHEIPIDDYALYAAWDNTNLYLMWEMANVQDAVAPSDDFPISQGNLWIYNIPVFLYLSIDPSIEGDGTVVSGETLWNSGITLDANIDTVVAFSTNYSNGPFVYKAGDDGKIVYNDNTQPSIKLEWGNTTISENLWGIDEGYGHYNNRTPGDTLLDTSNWHDFYTDKDHKKSIDMFYEMSIPLDLLGVTASEIESQGIGIMKVSTFGTSALNTLPADPSTWDNATGAYSNDSSTTKEKEDMDNITVPLARIGKLLAGGGSTPSTPSDPKPTEPTPTQPSAPTEPTPTQPSAPTEPTPTQPSVPSDPPVATNPTDGATDGEYYLGDADLNGVVNVKDATLIQKVTAGLEKAFKDEAFICADANIDTEVNVKDATMIQKFLAGLSIDKPVGEIVEI